MWTKCAAWIGLGLLALAFAGGCQSTGTPPSSAPAVPQKAVVLTTGNGTTTVLFPASDGNGVSALASAKVDHCAQCDADAAKYFKSGEIAPTCAVCGAKRTGVGGIN